MTGFEELPGLATLITAVPVIGVLISWLLAVRAEKRDWLERYERLEAEYRQALKDWSQMRQTYMQNESFMAGRIFQGDDPDRTKTGPLGSGD